jgi:hypothetical protein
MKSNNFIGGFTNPDGKFYKSGRTRALYIGTSDKPQACTALGRDVHLILEAHVVIDRLARHADVV